MLSSSFAHSSFPALPFLRLLSLTSLTLRVTTNMAQTSDDRAYSTLETNEKTIKEHHEASDHYGRHGHGSATSDLDNALGSLDLSSKDADEAFAYLRDHPQADAVRQEALEILADPKQLKKLMRKIDWTIVPMMIGVYFLQFLDKTTISYAAVMGIREDTGLKGQDYSNVAMMFYVGFSGC